MRKILLVLLAFAAIACTKPKKEECTTDSRVIGTWAQDSLVEYGTKYYTPYNPQTPGASQNLIEVTNNSYAIEKKIGSTLVIVNKVSNEIKCDVLRVDGSDGFHYVLINDTVLKTTAIPSGHEYWYHLQK